MSTDLIAGERQLRQKNSTLSIKSNGIIKPSYASKQEDEETKSKEETMTRNPPPINSERSMMIYRQLKTFSFEGATLKGCHFGTVHKCFVEIWYIVSGRENDDSLHDKLLEKLALELDVPKDDIRLVRLRQAPEYKITSCCPGDAAIAGYSDDRYRSVSAYVDVDGRGTLALLAGHGLQVNDEVRKLDGQPLGKVTEVCQSNPDDLGIVDAALSTVESPVEAFVTELFHGSLRKRHLTSPPIDHKKIIPGEAVQKFNKTPMKVTSTVEYSKYFSIHDPIDFTECIAVSLLHGPGESGTLITSMPRLAADSTSVDGDVYVDPYGMLIGTSVVVPDKGPAQNYSIAVPLDRTLNELERAVRGTIRLSNGRPRDVYRQVEDNHP